jgi:Flp pilus assembly protein TadD
MRTLLFIGACLIAVAAAAAPQGALGRATADRDRIEALKHYRLGQDALRSEHFDIAEREFQTASKLDPTLELAPYGLGQVYMATKRFRPAIVAYEKCREVIRANTVSAANDGLEHQKRVDDQIKALEDQQRIYSQPGRNASSPLAQNYLRQIDTQLQSMKASRFRTAGGPEPTPAWISLALGSAYFRADAQADAEREYRAAIEVDPRLGEAHNNLAVVLLLTGRAPEADTEIKAAEKVGFKVNPQLKEDVKKALAQR